MISKPAYLEKFYYNSFGFTARFDTGQYPSKKKLLSINCDIVMKDLDFRFSKDIKTMEQAYPLLTEQIAEVFFFTPAHKFKSGNFPNGRGSSFLEFIKTLYELLQVQPEDFPKIVLHVTLNYECNFLATLPGTPQTPEYNFEKPISLAETYLTNSLRDLFYKEENDAFFKEHFGKMYYMAITTHIGSETRKGTEEFWPIVYSTKLTKNEQGDMYDIPW